MVCVDNMLHEDPHYTVHPLVHGPSAVISDVVDKLGRHVYERRVGGLRPPYRPDKTRTERRKVRSANVEVISSTDIVK